MNSITLTFPFELNTSLQVGDVLYYKNSSEEVVRIGVCTAINGSSVTCLKTPGSVKPYNNDYIFFSKDNEINTSGLVGYYAEVEFTNDSTEYAELFAVNSEIFVSSN